jgi:uncharacterized membrane protein YcaP (DUF421 family)
MPLLLAMAPMNEGRMDARMDAHRTAMQQAIAMTVNEIKYATVESDGQVSAVRV